MTTETSGPAQNDHAFTYRVLRYTPNLVRDEWVNIGVLLFDPKTGERRLRLIEDQDEYARLRKLHPTQMKGCSGSCATTSRIGSIMLASCSKATAPRTPEETGVSIG